MASRRIRLSPWSTVLFVSLFLASSGQAAAADAPAEKAPAYTEEIVVSATRRPERSRNLPASVTIVEQASVEASPAATLDGVLEVEVPGFVMSRPGTGSLYGTSAARSVSLRGLGGTAAGRTLVLLDGVPLTDPLQGNVDWTRIPLDDVERVEVVRTATSTAWGNLALGGVIQVITRDPDRRRLVAEAAAGELGIARAGLSAAERRGRHGFLVAGHVLEHDGYQPLPPNQVGPADTKRSIEQNSAAVEWHVEPGTGGSFELSADWSSELRGLGTSLSSDAFEQVGLRGGGTWLRDGDLFEGHLYGQRQDQASRRGSVNATRTAETPSSDQYDIPASLAGASLQWSRDRRGRHQVTAGTDSNWFEAEVKDAFRFTAGHYSRRRTFGGESRLIGVFAQDSFRLSERWAFHLGARVDEWRLSNGRRSQEDLDAGSVISASEFRRRSRTVFSPTLGAVFQPRSEVALRLSLFSGFRAPTLFDLYRPGRGGTGGGGVLESNPDLQPERMTGAEVGARFDPTPSWSFDVAGYWNLIGDAIISRTVAVAGPSGSVIPPCGAVAANSPCRQKANVGELRSRGVELALQWRPAPRWSLRGNYARCDSIITEAPGEPQLIGKSNRLVAKHASALSVDWADPRWLSARLQARYLGERFNDDLNQFLLGDYLLFDASLSRQLTPSLRFFADIANLLDERYLVERDAASRESGPPRQISAGVRLRLGGA